MDKCEIILKFKGVEITHKIEIEEPTFDYLKEEIETVIKKTEEEDKKESEFFLREDGLPF